MSIRLAFFLRSFNLLLCIASRRDGFGRNIECCKRRLARMVPTGRPRPTSFAHSEQVEKPWRHDGTCAGPSQYRQRCNMKRLQTSAPLKPLKGRE